jgi:hypothetical protein
MTTSIQVRNKSNTVLKVTTMSANQDGSASSLSERLIMNGEPQDFVVNNGQFIVFAEAETSDDGDNAKVAALEAAAKEPQRLTEQRNEQVVLSAQPHDPNKQNVPHATPMANTHVEQIAKTNKTTTAQPKPDLQAKASEPTVAPMKNEQKAP